MFNPIGLAIAAAIWLPTITVARRVVVRRVRAGVMSTRVGAAILVTALALAPWLLWLTGAVQAQPTALLWLTLAGGVPGYFGFLAVLRSQSPEV